MNKTIALIGVAVIALATVLVPSASATPGNNLIILGVPAVLAAGTTNLASPLYVDVLRSQSAPVFASTIVSGSPGATNIYTFQPAGDGILFDTNAVHAVLVTNALIVASGVATNTWAVPLGTSGNFQAYRLASITTTGTATNLTHNVQQKIDSP